MTHSIPCRHCEGSGHTRDLHHPRYVVCPTCDGYRFAPDTVPTSITQGQSYDTAAEARAAELWAYHREGYDEPIDSATDLAGDLVDRDLAATWYLSRDRADSWEWRHEYSIALRDCLVDLIRAEPGPCQRCGGGGVIVDQHNRGPEFETACDCDCGGGR